MSRYFTEDHEWVEIDGDVGTVGITDYAQGQLGDVVFVELPTVGKALAKGGEAAVVESVKAASEIYTPVGGKVIEANAALEAEPERINADPYGAFIAVIEIESLDEAALMDAEQYDAFVASEG